jgi:sensor domain CHASE-containing protein
MSTKISGKLSKFFVIAMAVIITVGIVVVFTLRGILISLNTASQVDEKALENQHERINKNNLDKAYQFLTEPQNATLDLR